MRGTILIMIILISGGYTLWSQTATVTSGCSPLEVQFFAPSGLQDHYWDFVEGNTSSTLKDPIHIFTHPGTYLVTLYEGEGNAKAGEIEIRVYEDPVITILADTLVGCSPFTVVFSASVQAHPDIVIESYLWAFGDGSESVQTNPVHVYNVAGTFNVSLELFTNLPDCNVIFTEKELIRTALIDVKFRASEYNVCEVPARIKFINDTNFSPDYTYEWDFGNGQYSNAYDPDTVVYQEFGIYSAVLTVISEEGCEISYQRYLNVGKPVIYLDPPQIGCLHADIPFNNLTVANQYEWTFGPGANKANSSLPNPLIFFETPGIKSITFKAIKDSECFSDTTFTIEIEDPNAEFTINPIISCQDPETIYLEASEKSYTAYDWVVSFPDILVPPGSLTSFIYDDPDRDSLYLHKRDSIYISLYVTTENGCVDSLKNIFIEQKPNASFTPSEASGCAPLTVTFTDQSISREEIIRWTYYYGTGDSLTLDEPLENTFKYQDPGEYYVKLVIENEGGCIDTSAGVWIRVGETIEPEYELDHTEICLGDSITVHFQNDDPRIDAYHLYSDGGRFAHCWTGTTATHTFETLPGQYPVHAEIIYNGCRTIRTAPYLITVKGAKADLAYLIECDQPLELKLQDESTGATDIKWTIDTLIVEDSLRINHTFSNTGNYLVTLEAWDKNEECPSTFDSEIIHIRKIRADFEAPERVCDNIIYTLDAGGSIDVDKDCSKGFLWYIPTRRPWESHFDTIMSVFPKGENLVTLVVEDINGCRDTVSQTIRSYGTEPAFLTDKDEFCLPGQIQIDNITESDTTITQWHWNYGNNGKNPLILVEEDYPEKDILIRLITEDALGCLDTFSRKLSIYKPESQLYLVPGQNLCTGEKLKVFAEDFTEKGSKLLFNWDLGAAGKYSGQSQTIVMDKRGTYPLSLVFEEEDSGCRDSIKTKIYVVDPPIAEFITDVDGLSPLCHPEIITFENRSVFDSTGYVTWFIEGVSLANKHADNQTIELPKGSHDISLAAISVFGCSDTITRSFKLVGPEGKALTDKSLICLGDEVKFTMYDTVDVHSYEWDFGDGMTASNVNPVKHIYNQEVEQLQAKLILKSLENGCSQAIDIPLSIFEVIADFKFIPTGGFCPGDVFLENISEGADNFLWKAPGGEILSQGDTSYIRFAEPGNYDITLIASSTGHNCMDELTQSIQIEELKDLVIVPNMFTPNGDGENDYFRPVIRDAHGESKYFFTTFRVYNRWGNLVYDNPDPQTGWDGRFNQSDAPAGVYGYFMEVEINDCQTIRSQGNVTLVR